MRAKVTKQHPTNTNAILARCSNGHGNTV